MPDLMYSHDPELPAGLQDSDLEMASLTAQANRESRLAARGLCCHGWYKAPFGQPAVCLDCGKTFATEKALNAERYERLA